MPMLDRIDMCAEARRVKYEELTDCAPGETSAEIRKRVTAARLMQKERYHGTRYRFNADLDSEAVRQYCILDADCERMMKDIYENMGLTARAYTKILKVSRTIADLEGSSRITMDHLAEAVSYRAIDRKYWEAGMGAA